MTKEEILYLSIGRALKGATESQMFGKPCFKINGKAFMSLFNQTLVFKLHGEMLNEALSLDGAQAFDPSQKNRPMKEWVQVPFFYHEYWEKFAIEAMHYVAEKYAPTK